MGVKILIHIRHIRGHTFDVEVDRDADCIGLKVVIWDSQKIPVDTQRLVYGGREIADDSNLVNLGIDDGSTVFLVEKVDNVNPVPVVVSEPQPAPVVVVVPEESVSVSHFEPMSVSSQYQQLQDASSQERIQGVIDLAFWVRVYCIFGTVVSLGALSMCLTSLIPLACYVIGYLSCRRLSPCGLIFPMLLAILIGPVGFIAVLWAMATHFNPILFLLLFVSFLHVLIMGSICRLRRRIKALNCEEKRFAVEKIRAGIRCCCC